MSGVQWQKRQGSLWRGLQCDLGRGSGCPSSPVPAHFSSLVRQASSQSIRSSGLMFKSESVSVIYD